MSTVVNVGGTDFTLDRVTPAQVAGVLRIASRLSLDARRNLASMETPAETDFLWALLGGITEDDLISLAALSIGCDKKFAEEHFSLDWVIVALAAMLKNANIGAAMANFTSAFSQIAD